MSTQKSHSLQDWHPEDIKCAIRKKGVSMAQLARANGYKTPRTFSNVFAMPYPKVERIIAEFLEISPKTIWPSRYQEPMKITPSVHRRVA